MQDSQFRHTREAQRQLQSVRLQKRLVAQELPRRAVGGQCAVGDQKHAAARFQHQIQIVRGDELRLRPCAQDADQGAAVARVERGGRLVHEKRIRLHG